MKKIILSIAFLSVSNLFSQAFDGYADNKTSVGGTFQKGAIGAVFTFDRGINDYLSYGSSFGFTVKSDAPPAIVTTSNGIVNSYQIDASELLTERIDFSLRLNAHFGQLLGLNEMMDIYAGGNVALRAAGAQAGIRYLITDGFGFFAEASAPFYKYVKSNSTENGTINLVNYLPYYEQPVVGFGIIISD
jgi:outer membrane protein G